MVLAMTLGPAQAMALEQPAGGLQVVEVSGLNTGPIPDGTGVPTPCGNPGAPLNILFEVPALAGPIVDVEVAMSGAHTWLGDLTAELIAPDATTRHILFGSVGATSASHCGDASDFAGPYVFSDAAEPPHGGLWQAATVAGAVEAVPSGSYFTTGSGGHGAINPMPATSLAAAFGGLSASQAMGFWVLRITDGGQGDTGSINTATLRLYIEDQDSLFANGFENDLVTTVEHFDNVNTLAGKGWLLQNNSQPEGAHSWFQGNPSVFPAHQGNDNAYIASNYRAVASEAPGTISAWLVTPLLAFNGDSSVSFWTSTSTAQGFYDRLEVRVCRGWPCSDMGSSATSVGGFTSTLLTINPDLGPGVYPEEWMQYVLTAADGLPTNGYGRIAFRYHVTDGGPQGSNSDYIGLDTVEIRTRAIEGHGLPEVSAVPTPAPTPASSAAVTGSR